LKFEGEKFGIPNGPCINFEDFSGNKYAIFQDTVSETYLQDEYKKQNP
jgi:hypothetical protein